MKRRAALVAGGAAGGALGLLIAEYVAVIAIIRRRMWN